MLGTSSSIRHARIVLSRTALAAHAGALSTLLLCGLWIAGCAAGPDRSSPGRDPVSVETPDGASLVEASAAADVDPLWLATIERTLAEREYEASASEAGIQAPNRAHNLRIFFAHSGIRVHDRTAEGSPELLKLTLVGMGRGEVLGRVPDGEVKSLGARVEIQRPGVTEWYENSARGLEQGFTLASRPAGVGSELTVELRVEHANASLRGDQVLLETDAGRRLSYDKLVVVDVNGAPVAARLEVPDARHVRLVVADAGVRYPLTIDPLLSETADTQLEGNQLAAQLGFAVSGAGDVNGDGYDDVIVGAPGYDAGQPAEGAAFVFLGSASGIPNGNPSAAATLLESNQSMALFGRSVSGAGDVNGDGYDDVIVGANLYDAGETDEGVAFVFLGSASGVADGDPATAAAQLESNQPGAQLGRSVSRAGDVNGDGYDDVIVGARLFGSAFLEEGAAFVFTGAVSGVPDGHPGTAFLSVLGGQQRAQLGYSVSGAGDVNGDGYGDVIVGASDYDSPERDEGAAFVFLGSIGGGSIVDPAAAAAGQLESNQLDALLGFSVAGAGDVNGDGYGDVIVGAALYDAGETDEGAAFVFLGSASGIADGNPTTAAAQLESNQPDAQLGFAVSGAGDVNGDGYDDVIVGANSYTAGEASEGAAFLFVGSASGIADGNPATAEARLESDQAGAQLGNSVASAGDVNGDGSNDVIVGAYLFDNGHLNEGAAFLFLPEPSAIVLLATGVVGLGWLGLRRSSGR